MIRDRIERYKAITEFCWNMPNDELTEWWQVYFSAEHSKEPYLARLMLRRQYHNLYGMCVSEGHTSQAQCALLRQQYRMLMSLL